MTRFRISVGFGQSQPCEPVWCGRMDENLKRAGAGVNGYVLIQMPTGCDPIAGTGSTS